MLYVKMCAHRRGVFRPLCIVARKDIIERESVRHCCVTVAAVAIYRMDTQPGSRPATFPAVGLSTRRIIRIGLRAANVESRRPVRSILRRRGNGDVSTFSLTCVSRDQGRTSSLSLASINRKNRFTRPSLAVTSLCAYEAFFPTLFITEKVVKQFLERNQVVEEKR